MAVVMAATPSGVFLAVLHCAVLWCGVLCSGRGYQHCDRDGVREKLCVLVDAAMDPVQWCELPIHNCASIIECNLALTRVVGHFDKHFVSIIEC